MEPTVGRIVYYKSRGSADGVYPSVNRAAIVTDVRILTSSTPVTEVKLTVFNPEGLYFPPTWVPMGQKPGQWDWMPFQKQNMGNQSQSAIVGGMGAGYQIGLGQPRSDMNPN
jgi:hypothetical protein